MAGRALKLKVRYTLRRVSVDEYKIHKYFYASDRLNILSIIVVKHAHVYVSAYVNFCWTKPLNT